MSIETDVDANAMGAMPYDPPSNGSSLGGRMNGDDHGSQGNTNQQRSSTGAVLGKLYDLWDVDTTDVTERCKLSLNPLLRVPFLTNGLLDSENVNRPDTIVHGKYPDMWGPVWIYFTMVFSVFFSATTSDLFDHSLSDYDIGLLTGTAGTLFAFTFVVPVIVWFGIQYFNLIPTLTLAQSICLYGYSCTVWIPATLVTGSPLGAPDVVGKLPAQIINIASISIAFLLSARFIYGNLYKVMASQASQAVSVDKTKMTIVLVAGIVVHAALALTVMFL